MGLSVMAKDNCTVNSCVETKFGESQSGSFCSYQLTHTEANFVATVDICSIPRDDMDEAELSYPRFPLNSGSDFVRPDNLSHSEETLVSSLVVDENMINKIEEATRGQTSSEQWKKERKFRFLLQSLTSSLKDKGITISLQWISSIRKHLPRGMCSMV